MNPVVHFEMPYDDASRVSAFYKSAFGWKMKAMGEAMGRYVLASTAASGADGRPTSPGQINGGFFPKKPDWPMQHPSVVIAVDDLVTAMNKITRAGGRVLGEPMEIPGVGGYVSFVDTEGNRASLLQPLAREKPRASSRAKPKAQPKKRPAATSKAAAKSRKRKSAR
jgi:predicted enzyme related to lactoylglutathione lyase